MIFYNEQTGDWEFHKLEGLYKDTSSGEEVLRIEYVTNRRYLEERVMQWPHYSGLVIRTFEPTVEQQARLSELNRANVERIQEVYVAQYVQYGYIDAPEDENGVPINTGHTYLNTIIGRPENDQRKLDAKRVTLKEKVAHRRWLAEIEGMIINGLKFGTTDREKALMASKVVSAMNQPGATFRYKTEQGWITLTSDIIVQIGLTMDNYVQRCFDHEGQLVEQINGTEDLSTVDIEAGWPDNQFTLDLSGA